MRERRQRRTRLFLLQNRASLSARFVFVFTSLFFANRPNFALFGSVGVLGRLILQIATQGFLGAYMGIFTAEEKKEWALPVPVGNPIYNLGTVPMNVFIFIGNSSFTTPIYRSN